MDQTHCSHILNALLNEKQKASIVARYKSVISWNARRAEYATRPAKRRKIGHPSCNTCGKILSRALACLHCSYAGCWSDGHALNHLKETDHLLCTDVRTGYIYCSECEDFVYDSSMDTIRTTTVLAVEEKATRSHKREPYRPWAPLDKEKAVLDGATSIPCQGRRGLLNVGQTCFMNVILQSFIHNPLLRNYFLSDKHNHKLCKNKDCACCEMDKLFGEVFSDDPTPYGPVSFLATTWRASSELSGYAQQDAHEFFISALNQLHSTSRGNTNVSCICIVHSTFAGQLQSDVKCERCGNVTSTVDPMLDISLELKNKDGRIVSGETGDNTLAACLKRYTQPEKLGLKEYICGKCGKASHDASKRLSIKKLPPVLSFQFKRFEHKNGDRNSAQKVDAYVRFPAKLNMAPYTTLAMDASSSGDPDGTAMFSCPGSLAMYEYDLFAVICHEGQLNNGHYTNYARYQDEWYRFDDDKVAHSNLGSVLAASAYMCFYVKRYLDYKPYTIPSYIKTREVELEREKEREREKEAARMKEVEDALLATV